MSPPDADEDEDDYCYFGTALADEVESKAGAFRKPVQDEGSTRALPVWKQEPTDEQGRKRFHGAFTGGFSAGFFNTVGSEEGFEPATFKSSRSGRANAKQQSIDDFLDTDELEERQRTHLHVKGDYDTFGAKAAEAAMQEATRDAAERPSIIPGAVLEELVVPVANSIGMRLLQKMGWRPGRGVGTAVTSRQGAAGSKWGTVSGVSMDNTPLYVLLPKHDVHGLGFDPFKGAEEFRAAKQAKTDSAVSALQAAATGSFAGTSSRGGAAAGGQQRRGHGVAFGTGVLDESDTLGDMDDYVDHAFDSAEEGGEGSDGEGRPSSLRSLLGGAKKRSKATAALPLTGAAGRRATALARLGFRYQMGSSDEEEEGGGPGHGRGRPLLLGDTERPDRPLLQSSKDMLRGGDFIPGFKRSEEQVVIKQFPPVDVPAMFIPRHVFPRPANGQEPSSSTAGASRGAAQHQPPSTSALPPPPPVEVAPPVDPELRREADSLAAMVARSGQAVEDLARKKAAASLSGAEQEAAEPGAVAGARVKFGFLIAGGGGAGAGDASGELAHAAMYYVWRLHRIRSALAAVGASVAPAAAQSEAKAAAAPAAPAAAPAAPQQDRQRLSVEQRIALLGEVPLASSAAAQEGLAAAAAAAAAAKPPGVSAGDRSRVQEALQGAFVRGSTQDMNGELDAEASRFGLQAPAAAALAASFAGRFAGGSSAETAVLAPQQAGLRAAAPAAPAPAPRQPQRPVRSFEDWRPEPLLCRRLNVPDPYAGKAKPEPPSASSRFRTEQLVLLDSLGTGSSAAAASNSQQQLPPPPHQSTPPLPGPPARPPTSLPPPPSLPPSFPDQTPAQRPASTLLAPAPASMDAKSMAADFLSTFMSTDEPAPLDAASRVEQSMAMPPPPPRVPAAAGPGAGAAAVEGAPGGAAEAEDVGELGAGPLDRPLDLFKAIFEAEDDDEEEEQVKQEEQEVKRQIGASRLDAGAAKLEGGGPADARGGGGGAAPAHALADALMQAQELMSARAKEARAQQAAAAGAAAAVDGLLPRGGEAAGGPGVVQDPALQDRILNALATLRGMKKKGRKEEKEKKEKKEKKGKRSRRRDEEGKGKKGRKMKVKGEKRKKKKKQRREEKGGKGGGERASGRASASPSSSSATSHGSGEDSGDSSGSSEKVHADSRMRA